jgi:DNA-binding transcriptional LysR family regulator
VELRQLQHFLAVAEERHFTRAARRLHIVQSGLSGSIRALETELGAPLFIRSTRRVELTEAARALLPEARRALAAVESARDAVTSVQGLLRGTLSVGIMQRLAAALDLPAILGRFHAEHPGVTIRLRQAGSAVMMEDVRTGRLDLAILGQVGRPPEGVATTELARERLLLALPPAHPLAGRKEIALSALGEESFVEFHADWGVRMLADRAFAAARVDRKIACEVNDVPTLLDLVANGIGIALVPQTVTSYPARILYVAPRPPVPTWDVVVAVPAHQPANPSARALLAAILADRG